MLQAACLLHRRSLTAILGRCLSGSSNNDLQTFRHKDLNIKEAKERQPLPKEGEPLGFGELHSDHMLEIDWSTENGWQKPSIHPYQNLSLDPSCKVFHYACELFEGMKAYRGVDGRVRLFRPQLNMARMRRSAVRAALPDFDGDELLQCIRDLIRLDEAWVPHQKGASLYIRPTLIGTEPRLGVSPSQQAKLFVISGPVGAYFKSFKPISLLANAQYIRAAKGGVGAYKMGCNYAPTMFVGLRAIEKGYKQVLWLHGTEHQITEAGAMNVFMYWKNERGEDELITPSTQSGLILPGITRQSILDLSHEMGGFRVTERDFTMDEIRKALKENRVYEFFGSGTAVVVIPVENILYLIDGREEMLHFPVMDENKSLMQRLFKTLQDIQFGRVKRSEWTVEI